MDKTDSKIRLFLEFSHNHPIQIQEVIPLLKYEEWNPQKMYYLPKHQYYYVFINDNELLSRIKGIESVLEDIKKIKEENSIRIEFNANEIYDFYVTEQFHDEECTNCAMLPICQGGCNANRLLYGSKFACPPSKSIVKKLVMKYYHYVTGE